MTDFAAILIDCADILQTRTGILEVLPLLTVTILGHIKRLPLLLVLICSVIAVFTLSAVSLSLSLKTLSIVYEK